MSGLRSDVSCSKQIPEGKYVIIMDEDWQQLGTFDMEKTRFCLHPHVGCVTGKSVQDVREGNAGLHKALTTANMLLILGEMKGFYVATNVLHEQRNDKKLHGLLLGPIDAMPHEDTNKLMSCLRNDMGYITENMWYMYEVTRKSHRDDMLSAEEKPAAKKQRG